MHKSVFITILLLLAVSVFGQEKKRNVRVIPDENGNFIVDTVVIQPGTITRDSVLITGDTIIADTHYHRETGDSLVTRRVFREFTLSQDFSEEIDLPADTGFALFHRFRRADMYSPLNAMQGNYGLPSYQINFFDRVTDPDKFLYSYYYPFMFVPDRSVFMNTQTPFTELKWSFGGMRRNSEQTFRIKHSQNVNRYLNFGLIYDIIFSLGQFSYQRSDNKNFNLFTSYTGKKYEFYISGGLNNITSLENGGITDPGELPQRTNMRDVLVNLGGTGNAASRLKNKSLLLVQRYTIGGGSDQTDEQEENSGFLPGLSGTFSHILTIEGNRRTYEDNFPSGGFYDTAYINTAVTFDSLASGYIKNTVRFDFMTGSNRKFRLGAGAGIRSEVLRFGQVVPGPDTLSSAISSRRRVSNAVTGKVFNNIGNKFRWSASGDFYLNGYRMGDFNLDGIITKSFEFRKGIADWNVTGGLSNRQPSYWYQHWGSNHFIWERNLNKEFRINAGTSFIYPARNTRLAVNYAIIDNYTGFDTTAMPFQHTGGLSVAALTLGKELRAWKFHLASDVVIQKTSNRKILDLPLVALRSSGYFEHHLKFRSTGGDLNTQIGVEAIYHTSYNSYAYMPATGRFHNQDYFSAGNYPFINVFVNLKLKRTRIFVMYDHLNSGNRDKNFFMIPSYPMNIKMIRYGIGWTFYD
jgi:hypothetical protein